MRHRIYSFFPLILFCFVLLCSACSADKGTIGPYGTIQNFDVSPDKSRIALITESPDDYFSPQVGLESWQILVFDTNNGQLLNTFNPGDTLSQPYSLQFSPLDSDSLIYSTMNHYRKPRRGELVYLNMRTGVESTIPISFRNFSISNSGHQIVMWEDWSISPPTACYISIHTFPDLNELSLFKPSGEFALNIVDVFWSSNDKNLVIVSENQSLSRGVISIVEKETLQTLEQFEVYLGGVNADSIDWNPENSNLIVFSQDGTFVYNVESRCFIHEEAHKSGNFMPIWGTLDNEYWYVQTDPRFLTWSEYSLRTQQIELNYSQCP